MILRRALRGSGDGCVRGGCSGGRVRYHRREPKHTVWNQVVRENLASLLAEADERYPSGELPPFIQGEFDRYLSCGLLENRFARVRCSTCRDGLLVAYFCENRGVCSSCSARRMADEAAHLREQQGVPSTSPPAKDLSESSCEKRTISGYLECCAQSTLEFLMTTTIFAEPVDNHPRCPCILLLDTSGSMRGTPIDAINAGLRDFHHALMNDELARKRVEVAIITFDDEAKCIVNFTRAKNLKPPILKVTGQTAMGKGILLALKMLEERNAALDANDQDRYEPWIFLITDGRPEGEEPDLVKQGSARLKALHAQRRLLFHAVGVQSADMAMLAQISPTKPQQIQGLDFKELFEFISKSVSKSVHASPELGDQPPRDSSVSNSSHEF